MFLFQYSSEAKSMKYSNGCKKITNSTMKNLSNLHLCAELKQAV